MRIESIEALPYQLPLAKPVVMSHVTITTSQNVLVRVTTDEGIIGWGEGVEAPTLTGETQARIVAGVEFLAQHLIGRNPLRRTELWHQMRGLVYGNDTAISAIDIALHDIAGKAHGIPVVELLGGRQRDVVPALTLLGSGDPEADTQTALERYNCGVRWFKLKLAIGDAETELKTFRSLREALGSDAVLCGDANQGWSESEAKRFLRELEGLDIAFIEQPITQRDPDALIRVALGSPVLICVDESIHSHDDIVRFGRTGLGGTSLKLVKLGGLTGLMRGAVLCETFGLAINLAGKVAESSVSAAANIHAAAATRRLDFGCSPANLVIADDVVSERLEPIDGSYPVPEGPGLGIHVDEDKVRALQAA